MIVNYNRSRDQARADAADAKLTEAVAKADQWLGGDKSPDPEQDLVSALADERVRNKASGESMLQKVRDKKANAAADRLPEEARQALDKDQLPAAVEKLRAYVASPNGTQKAVGQELLAEIEAAMSQDAAVTVLTGMSDLEYQEFKRARQLPAGKLHPTIARRRIATFVAAIPAADRKREADRVAAAERKKAEADAAAESAREAPLEVFLGGTLRGKDAASWRLPMKFYEVSAEKPKSEFDRPDKYESKYNLGNPSAF